MFSLEIVNFDKDLEEFDPNRAKAVPALRTALKVRELDGNEAMGRFYEAIGTRYFHAIEPLTDPGTIEGSLADAGLDPTRYHDAVTDESTWETLVAEQMEEASKRYAKNQVAMQLRAMNMTYESIKEKGALMVVPTGMADSMNPGILGVAAAGFSDKGASG